MADQGAVKAVPAKRARVSLCLVVKAEGAFSFSDIITVHDGEIGQVIGKGRTCIGVAAIKVSIPMVKSQRVSPFTDD